jgi:hypothetical protein
MLGGGDGFGSIFGHQIVVRIAIVGSRDYPDLAQVRGYVSALPANTHVVSGGARGVDRAAEQAARARGLPVTVLRADWARFGRSAGFRRNALLVRAADCVIAFWDGRSRGTAGTIEMARRLGKHVEVVRPGRKFS